MPRRLRSDRTGETFPIHALRALFTGIGLTELALGIALWLWGRHVGSRSSGRRGAIANTFSRVGLTVGVTALIGRLLPLFR